MPLPHRPLRERHLPAIERGPLRPPSERHSVLLRVVRNCPWNKCSFCPAYKGEKFSPRDLEEVLADVQSAAAEPGSGTVRSVFLQDADVLATPVDKLATILRAVREGFPGLERVTAYARSTTLVHREVADLERLRAAGLTRVHVGVESGSDEVLTFVRKGVTAAQHLEGGRRVRAAGLELCCYVMPGLGGRRLSERHAADTGRLMAVLEPEHVRLRTCSVLEGTPLADDYRVGRFEPLSEVETVRELRAFLIHLERTRTELVSDHRINLLMELEGALPAEHARLLGVIDGFLGLGPEDQELFVAGRRLGMLRRLEDLADPRVRAWVEQAKHLYRPVVPVPRDVLF